MAIKAAPKVEKAEAQAAKPKEAPIAKTPLESSAVVADKPSHAGAAYADLPTERGSCMSESVTPFSQSTKDNSKLSVDELRSCHTIVFESQAAVIIGPADKSICKRILPLLFDERDFLSYGVSYYYILWYDMIVKWYMSTNCSQIHIILVGSEKIYSSHIK